MARQYIGEIPLDVLPQEQVLSAIEEFVDVHTPHQVITLNSIMYNHSLGDSVLKNALLEAHLLIPDSIGIVLAARYLSGMRLERIPGIELMLEICRLAERKLYRVYFLGAQPEVSGLVCVKIREMFPGLVICGCHHGYFSKNEEENVINGIRACVPDILFVALSVPAQEKWIFANLNRLAVPVVMGVGGSFDVISGKLKRAPLLVRKAGLEWLFRFIQQPWRFSRILDLPRFVFNVLKLRNSS